MPLSPQRPFIPHRTPRTAQPPVVASEFRLSPPFVPRADTTNVANGILTSPDAAFAGHAAVPQAEVAIHLPPIEEFLHTGSEFDGATQERQYESDYVSGGLEDEEELPPVEHFVDPLPEVGAFAPDSATSLAGGEGRGRAPQRPSGSVTASEAPATEWVETDWQQFDWRSVAALGESETANVEASNAWAATDWDARLPRPQHPRESAADAIARALDEIAQRIRNGDLSLPSGGAPADPATIAATLATLLGVRR